jgi:hypothetical protein
MKSHEYLPTLSRQHPPNIQTSILNNLEPALFTLLSSSITFVCLGALVPERIAPFLCSDAAEVEGSEWATVTVDAEWAVVVSLTLSVAMRAEHAPLSVHTPAAPKDNGNGEVLVGRR